MAFALIAAVFAITLPFGVWRARTQRYSLAWFLAIHVPIPFIFLLRVAAGYSYTFIPFTLSACVAGQLVGGRLGARLLQRRGDDGPQREAKRAKAAQTEIPAKPATVISLGEARSRRRRDRGRADSSG